jgi:hypothetical protein
MPALDRTPNEIQEDGAKARAGGAVSVRGRLKLSLKDGPGRDALGG